MCGIVGYIGKKAAVPLLVEGLRRLEYRGYDSAGICTLEHGALHMRKCVGRVARLAQLVKDKPAAGSLGISHTRWATHGPPNQCNAHPQLDCKGEIAVVHNGIIENATPLKRMLEEHGHLFVSDTDTEVLWLIIGAPEETEFLPGSKTKPDMSRWRVSLE